MKDKETLKSQILPLTREVSEIIDKFSFNNLKSELLPGLKSALSAQRQKLEANLLEFIERDGVAADDAQRDVLEHKFLKPIVAIYLAAAVIAGGGAGAVDGQQIEQMQRVKKLIKDAELIVRSNL